MKKEETPVQQIKSGFTIIDQFFSTLLLVIFLSACDPSKDIVFSPATGHSFNSKSATVIIQGLLLAKNVCYSTNGNEPSLSNGTCSGSGVNHIPGPVTLTSIDLNCGNDTGSSVSRTVKINYDWADGSIQSAFATYHLNCDSSNNNKELRFPVRGAFYYPWFPSCSIHRFLTSINLI